MSVFVWLGSPKKNESPKFRITTKKAAGLACVKHSARGTENWERRFLPKQFPSEWENNWTEIVQYLEK